MTNLQISSRPKREMDREEKRARNRAHADYLRNALAPTGAPVFDDITIAELKIMARDWVETSWKDYLG